MVKFTRSLCKVTHKKGYPLLPLLFNNVSPSAVIKEVKLFKVKKQEIKLSLIKNGIPGILQEDYSQDLGKVRDII